MFRLIFYKPGDFCGSIYIVASMFIDSCVILASASSVCATLFCSIVININGFIKCHAPALKAIKDMTIIR